MRKIPPVRVELSYIDSQGMPLRFHDYPDTLEFPELVFTEQVTDALVLSTLSDTLKKCGMPDGVSIHWEAIDSLPEGKSN